MKHAITKTALVVSVTLLCGCNKIVPSAESIARDPTIQVVTHFASGDRLIWLGAFADGPCTHASAQALISDAAKPEDVSAEWAGEEKVIVSVGSGTLEKSNDTAMNGKVTIEYRQAS